MLYHTVHHTRIKRQRTEGDYVSRRPTAFLASTSIQLLSLAREQAEFLRLLLSFSFPVTPPTAARSIL